MRILFVLQYYYPYIGGLERLFAELAVGLVQQGHAVKVVTTRLKHTPAREVINGVDIVRVKTPLFANRYFFTLFGLPTAVREAKKVDVIHTAPYNGAPPAFFAARLAGRPIIFTALEVLGSRWSQVEHNPIKAWMYRLFEKVVTLLPYDRIVAISQATMDDVKRRGGSALRGQVIYPGVDEDFTPRTPSGALRTRLGIKTDDFIYLYFGRPGITKGVDRLLRAAPDIQKVIPNAHLVLILADEPHRQNVALQKVAGMFPDRSHISFMPSLPRDELVDYLCDANCIVIPSLTEGFGLTAAEACALGIPVVATNVGSLPEVVSGKHILVEAGSTQAIAEAVVRIWHRSWDTSPPKKFTWNEMVASYEQLYEEILAR